MRGTGGQATMPYAIKEVANHDVAGIVERVDEIIYEILKSQSAGLTDMRSFDRTRIDEYIALLDRYANWVVAAPDIDLPETHPRMYPIRYLSEELVNDVENKALRDVVRMYQALIIELTASQSAAAASGLTVHDKRRFDLLQEKVKKFMSEYVDQTHPIDMPESAPSSPPIERGLR